jgi:hypothetical protein
VREEAISQMPLNDFQRLLKKERNRLARKRWNENKNILEEEFQFGPRDFLKDRLTDLSDFLVSRYTSTKTLFTAQKLETLISTVVILGTTENNYGKLAALSLCINSLSGRSISGSVYEFLQKNHKDFFTEETLQSSPLRSTLDSWERLNDSQFIEKIRNVASYCMAFSVLETMGFKDSVAEVIYAEFKVQKKSKQVTSFIHAILDAIEFTCSRLLVCVQSGSLGPLLHTASTYTNWFDQTQKLEKWTSMLTCDPETLEFSFQQYEKELIDAIKIGQNFVKHAKSANDRKSMTIIVNRLELFLADFQTRHIVGKSRLMPFGVSVFGDSSVGKSSFVNILFSYSAKCLQQKDDPEYMYTRNFRDQFWSGFKSHKWFIFLDDVGSIKPSAVNGTDPSVDEIISLMNTVSMLCNMADLSEKGRIAARPLVVVATTNHPWMNVQHYSYHPSALMRRFPYRVTVSVHPDYQMDGAPTMLDPAKCQVDYSVSYPDFWVITVDKVLAAPLPKDGGAPPCEPILVKELENVRMSEFLPWYRKKLLAHMNSQKDIQSKMSTMSNVKMCEHFVPIGNCAECGQLQVGVTQLLQGATKLTFKERIIASLIFLYLWLYVRMERKRAHINAFRRAIPALRLTNSAIASADAISQMNPFSGLQNLTLQAPVLPNRNDIADIAKRFYQAAIENKKYVALAATITVTAGIIKFLKTADALQFSFMKPVPKDEKKAAKWTNDTIHLSPLSLSRQTKSMKGLSRDQILEIVGRNVVGIRLYHKEGLALDNCMFALGGNIYLVNKHVLDRCPDSFKMDCVFMQSSKAGTRNTSITFSKKSIRKVIDDVAFVELNNFPPAAKLDCLLPAHGFDVRTHGVYLKRELNGDITHKVAKNIGKGHLSLINADGYWSDCPTVAGDCGSVLVGFTEYGPVIMGIHTAGKVQQGKAFCSRVYYEDVVDFPLIDPGYVSLQTRDKEVTLSPVINKRDPIFYLDESVCAVYGTLSTGTSNIKSNVKKSLISTYFEEKGWSTQHERPNLGTWKPWYHAMKDMASPTLRFTSAEALELARISLRQMFENLPNEEKALIQLYDLDTAVSGSPGVNYVNSLAMKTSLGFPWKRPKMEKFSFCEDLGKYIIDEEIEQRVLKMIENYRIGVRCNPIFCGSEKDEARAHEKNEAGKIRLFMGAPTDLVITMRMFFGSLIRVIQRNPSAFECAVGVNAHSKDWHNLATDLLGFGDNCLFDGDYQAYDKLMESVLIYSCIKAAGEQMVENLDDLGGFSKEELEKIYMSIATDVAFAYIDFNGTLVSFLRNHVSGEPLTVIINCFVGSVYVRYAYRRAIDDDYDLKEFVNRVILRTYGDDNIVSVNPTILSKFNFQVMQEKLKEIGVNYTRADKKPGHYISKPLGEIEFLKRGFIYSEELGRYVGPLAEASIQKSFLIGNASKSITQEERDLATMNSGLREYFFHGQEKYCQIRAMIYDCCSTLQIKFNPKNFPPYEYYLEKYREDDIVHFEYYDIEEVEEEELFQCGEIYSVSGPDNAPYFPAWMDGDFMIEKTFAGDYRVTHIAFTCSSSLKKFLDETGSYIENRTKFLIKAKVYRLRARWNAQYRYSLIAKIGAKVVDLVFEDVQWGRLNTSSLAGWPVTREEANPPLPDWENGVFNQYETDSNQSINGGTVDRVTVGAEDYLSDASSGDSEHWVRHDYDENEETFQASSEVIMSFADENVGAIAPIGKGMDSTRNTSVYKDAEISRFLERPVLISTITWAENSNVNSFVNPYYAFFNDSRIKNKVTNYSLLRCNMKIKVMINASPFYYGHVRVAWKPLTDYYPDNIIEVVGQDGWRVPYSQIPGLDLFPQNNQGGEMNLPFFYHKNWLRVTNASEVANMGQLQIRSFTPLYNANSVASSDVTIQIYAWAENVELSGPTIAEALQSGDEYQTDGPISGPASAVAEAAGSLSKIPLLKPYALATQMISSKVADVARYFGFTNVANLEAEKPQHPGAFYGMASTNMMTPYESLTIDDKNELTIDPRVAGIEPKDELLISEFTGRESWLWQSSWSSSQSVDSLLFLSRVMPELIRTEGSTLYRQSTPMAHINRMFFNWRGDIKFRFRFICSKYHRGRVRITYDPDGNLFSNSVTSSTSVTRIVDIAEESDVEITVPYMQATSFLKTAAGVYSFIENCNGGSAAVTRDPLFDNGQISVRIFTKQTSPVADAPIIMQVFVSAPDIEFAAPSEVPHDFSVAVLQSGEEQSIVTTNVDNNDAHIYQVHFGEKITSLRQLLRRKHFYYAAQLYPGVDGNDSAATVNKLTLPRLPVQYGFVSNGGFTSPGILTPGTQFRANYVSQTPLSLLMPCFVGVTGSLVYSLNVDSSYPAGSVYASRGLESYTDSATAFKPTASDVYIDSSHGTLSKKFYYELPTGGAGRVLTNQQTQAGLTFKVPMYSNRRFLSTNYLNIQANTKVDGSEMDTFTTVVWTKPNGHNGMEKSTNIQYYYMAGSDFNLLYFRNVPTFSVYNLPWPTA